ncbi:MAG: glycogen debranching protein GlgX [Anaerolineae bacterium]|nr:glycogen debranching protein GlgX [Anaerolineae bacterium]
MKSRVFAGQSFPLGASVYPWGVNFCIFSKNCEAVDLLFFDHVDDAEPAHIISLDPDTNRTFYYWHAFVRGVGHGQLYGYRVYGPYEPEKGLYFDGEKVLLDPYTRAVAVGAHYSREAAKRAGDNCAQAFKSVVVNPRLYDWEGDLPLRQPNSHTVIYELHVGGFTRHESSSLPPQKRGTYAGLIEKIPYLKELGITVVELLPVQQFDPQDAAAGLSNYWGYTPVAFFAPHQEYCSQNAPTAPVNEFRDMVKALHRANIEVILDVVFNHTAEGSHRGPTFSFRGLENRAYYIPDAGNPARYANYSGTGNTLNTNQSIVRRMIMDCLHYWVEEMHVDGFRFDLASVLARDEVGHPLKSPPILWEIESDPVLAGTRIIAEAWDAAGLYQVGSFIGHRWAEWNGQFRDDARCFVKGDPGMTGRIAARIQGSPDLYSYQDREPNRGINFVTCHDGFTLNDLVSYNEKHNEANGEQNRDGANANFSWNCGVEGPALNANIEQLRRQQVKNLLVILFMSQGTPMILMGDEVRRTQGGNNNAYCQNNEISWFNWQDLGKHRDILRFTRGLIELTQAFAIFRENQFWNLSHQGQPPIITWHGVTPDVPDWSYNSRSLVFELNSPKCAERLYVILNAYWKPLTFSLPELPLEQHWHCVVDTARESPHDYYPPQQAPDVEGQRYYVEARSSVILLAH